MTQCRYLAIAAILLLAGCVYNSREKADQAVGELTSHPYDQQPPAVTPPVRVPLAACPPVSPPHGQQAAPATREDGASAPPRSGTDVRTVALLEFAASLPAHRRAERNIWT